MASLGAGVRSVLRGAAAVPGRVLLHGSIYAFVPFLMVWWWVLCPLATFSMMAAEYAFIYVYRAYLSVPLRVYRHYRAHASQWTAENYAAALQSVGLAWFSNPVERLVWASLDSSVTDGTVIFSQYILLSIWKTLRRGGHRALELFLILMFYVPHSMWTVVFSLLLMMVMLGGISIGTAPYVCFVGARDATVGEDFQKQQRQKFEANTDAYQPLGRGHIRVLRLLPGRPGDPLRCELETVELTTARYEALSYVWGNPTMDRKIQTTGQHLWITRNLYHALSYLRHETNARILWVDALCINQIDYDECQQQVSQMRDIYHLASHVVVWLGIAPFGLRKVFENARQNAPLTHQHYGTIRVVAQLLRTSYWMRVWVVQELIVAREVVVQCSEHKLDWERFCRLADSAIASPLFPSKRTFAREYQALEKERREMQLGKFQGNLLQLLYDSRRKQATKERDKIFAFLGLSNLVSIGGGGQVMVQPDYKASSDDIFRDFGVKSINASGSLAIMALSECVQMPYQSLTQNQKLKLTWCPDWIRSGNDFGATPFWIGEIRDVENPLPWSNLNFSAAGGLPSPKCEVVESLVRLEGWEADEIVEVGQRTAEPWPYFDNLQEFFQVSYIRNWFLVQRDWTSVFPMWQSLALKSGGSVLDKNDMNKAFYKTITAGVYSDGKPPDTEEEAFTRAIHAACYGRRFFITATGRLGLGPTHTMVGDKIFVLLGSNVPVILGTRKNRPHAPGTDLAISKTGNASSVYLNVGQAYMDDLMTYRGDLKKDLEEGHQVADYVYLV